jgi:hypothetical protein
LFCFDFTFFWVSFPTMLCRCCICHMPTPVLHLRCLPTGFFCLPALLFLHCGSALPFCLPLLLAYTRIAFARFFKTGWV